MQKVFVYQDLSWSDYGRLADSLERRLRLCYSSGTLELSTIDFYRGHLSRLVCCMVFVLSEELAIPFRATGNFTYERPELDCAIECDETFYLKDVAVGECLSADRPPDLAVEVETTRHFVDRMQILKAVGVPEIWQIKSDSVEFYQRHEDEGYVAASRSRFFPLLEPANVLSILRRTWTSEENRLLKDFRKWVQDCRGSSQPVDRQLV
jgi:Uma2 family endonuclease